MNKALRELRDDIQMCLMRLIEIEQYYRDRIEPKVEVPPEFPQRTHTGTWRGRKLEAPEDDKAA